MRRLEKPAALALLLTAGLAAAPPAAAADVDTIGYTALAARPGALKANGAGVTVAQVEAAANPAAASYAPDVTLPTLAGRSFTYRSGASAVSAHASQVAAHYYATGTSPAGGVADVLLFSAASFVDGLLRRGQSGRAPGKLGAQVVNNSWVAGFSSSAANADALRRLDDLINRDDVLVFTAVDNDATKAFPKLLAPAYNGIAVGTPTGSHGPIGYDGKGPRTKPDLIVDAGVTSNASADAAGAGALLRSEAAARHMAVNEAAIKAILMAGAERDASWHRGRPTGADNVTAPLDFQQGAGQLRVDRSFDILTAGRQKPGVVGTPDAGWDSRRTPQKTSQDTTYYFRVDQTLPEWSAVLTWNRVIAGLTDDGYSTATTMADFSLSLYRQRKGGRRLVARSDSPYDNVETLTLTDLTPGTYQMVLATDRRSSYAVAWYAGDGDNAGAVGARSVTRSIDTPDSADFAPVAVPAPGALTLLAPVAGFILARRPRRPTQVS